MENIQGKSIHGSVLFKMVSESEAELTVSQLFGG